jgi:large subunit ribosomal protein L15
MVTNKRKKSSRQRASNTHGWGMKKKRRGAGNRGGRGNAGRGKRSDHKLHLYLKNKDLIGGKGFVMHGVTKKIKAINVGELQHKLNSFVQKGLVEKKGDVYIVHENSTGYTKILGSGQLRLKLHVTAHGFSKKAIEKIKKAGGEVIVLNAPTPEEA